MSDPSVPQVYPSHNSHEPSRVISASRGSHDPCGTALYDAIRPLVARSTLGPRDRALVRNLAFLVQLQVDDSTPEPLSLSISLKDLSANSGYSRATVQQGLAVLRQHGILRLIAPARWHHPPVYQFIPEAIPTRTREEVRS